VQTENPSACAMVNWNVCKSAIAQYCLYLGVIKRECVTEMLINPIIRTGTRRFCCVYHPTRDNMLGNDSSSACLLHVMLRGLLF
jgi:hypothetical protein